MSKTIKFVENTDNEKQLEEGLQNFKDNKISKPELLDMINRNKSFSKMSLDEYKKLPLQTDIDRICSEFKKELGGESVENDMEDYIIGPFRLGSPYRMDEHISRASIILGTITGKNIDLKIRTIDVID